ncbi:hypothetical protein VEE69_07490 [Escherichia coli]|nr:hypothetical protein VEE69_07490 [Escherichia coli]
MGEISVKTGNNARNGGKNSLNRLIRCVCGKKIGPDPRNFNQRVNLGRNDLLIRTFPSAPSVTAPFRAELSANPAETVVEGPFSKDVILKITYN